MRSRCLILSDKKINITGRLYSAERCLLHCSEGLQMSLYLVELTAVKSGLAVKYYACARFLEKTNRE